MKIFRNPDAMWREEDESRDQANQGLETGEDVADIGTSIILHSGKMHSLNILGTEIWKLLDGKSLDEIVASLQEGFEVEEEVLREDIKTFLSEMKEEGLIYEE